MSFNSHIRSLVSACERSAMLAAVFVTVGCTPVEPTFDRTAVDGMVMLDGKPLGAGTIRFVPTAGQPAPKISLPIQAGHFEADAEHGPGIGVHRVEIQLTDSEEFAHDDEEALNRLKAQRVSRIVQQQLPAIYNENSTLTATIEKGDTQTLQFALKTK